MSQTIEAKRKLTTVTENGDIFLAENPFEAILEEFFQNSNVSSEHEKGYKSSDPFEPSYGPSMEVSSESYVSIERLKEIFEWSDDALDLIENAVDNYDCYECWEKFAEEYEDSVESDIPGYSISSSSISIRMSKDRTKILLDFEVSDYEFSEEEYVEAYAPDPYDEYRDRMLDNDW